MKAKQTMGGIIIIDAEFDTYYIEPIVEGVLNFGSTFNVSSKRGKDYAANSGSGFATIEKALAYVKGSIKIDALDAKANCSTYNK